MDPTEQKKLAGKTGWTPERRAAQAERAKRIAEKIKAKQSQSIPPNDLQSSSGIPTLPSSPSQTSQTQTSQTTSNRDPLQSIADRIEKLSAEKPKKDNKRLPTDPNARKAELTAYAIPARGPVMILQAIFTMLGWDAMTDDEYEANVDAWSALFWHLGWDHPILGVVMVTGGTIAPRATKAMISKGKPSSTLQTLPQAKKNFELEPEPQ